MSVHGLLASYVAFDDAFISKAGKHAAWRATWPSIEDFKASMPLFWPERCRREWSLARDGGPWLNQESLHSSQGSHGECSPEESFSVLAPRVMGMLEAQTARYRHDFKTAMSLIPSVRYAYERFPGLAENSFKHAWCIVNTRCLYYNPSSLPAESKKPYRNSYSIEEEPPDPRNQFHDSNEFMVFCPLIDLFNHTSNSTSACKVTHDSSGFTVRSQRAYAGGQDEEIFVSYGSHSNDFLLVEYGFLLPDNENMHDSTSLDSVVLPMLSVGQKRRLDVKGYLGEYMLLGPAASGGQAGVCWRTEVVARIDILSAERWEGFVDGLLDEGELGKEVEEKAKATIRAWVERIAKQAEKSVQALERIGKDQPQVMSIFGDDVESGEQAKPAKNTSADLKNTDNEVRTARRRYDLVTERWRQILQHCHAFLLHQDRK